MNKKNNLELKPCPLGCLENDSLVVISKDWVNGQHGHFRVVKCQHCGLMRTNPRILPDKIGEYYPPDYGPYRYTNVQVEPKNSKTNKTRNKTKFLLQKIGLLFKFNTDFIPNIKEGVMLEIGCASGAFLNKMQLKGWDVQGIELSEAAGNSARKHGFKVHIGPIESAQQPEEKFDFIAGWMVLEHLPNPIETLTKLRGWAKDNAIIALSVPNAGSLEFNIFKDKWYALQVPTHYYHYTPKSATKVLEMAGWCDVKIYHQRILNNAIVSFGYTLKQIGLNKIGSWFMGIPNKYMFLRYIMYPIGLILSSIGETGRMTIVAKAAVN